jgi:DivIVA domain-containing protein
MDLELQLNSRKVIDKEFKGVKNGYDPLEVDKFLDIVVQDYLKMERASLEFKTNLEELQKTLKIYKDRLDKLEIDNAVLSKKMANISDNDNVSFNNIDLVKRIASLEQALSNAGIDPTKIK